MTVCADGRLGDASMTPVTCRPCGAEVLVRKSSWAQTSVQWNAQASARCAERAQTPASADGLPQSRPGVFLVCTRLRASIESAAGTGALAVLDES
jgi:hypothetical protein